MRRKKDPYKTLGVDCNATDEEIKKAFRKLALRYHPDQNPGSTSAEKRFREVKEAYDILSDENKRRAYDLYGHDGGNETTRGFASQYGGFDFPGFGSGAFRYQFHQSSENPYASNSFYGSFSERDPFEEILENLFSAKKRRSSSRPMSQRGNDLEYDLTIEFLDAYHGVKRRVRVLDRVIEVHIPAGVDTGSRIRVAGQGAPGLRGGAPGDLFLTVSVNPHPLFQRKGIDVSLHAPITISEAILGGEIEVPSPDGSVVMKIAAGTQTGTVFRFRGKGFPALKTGERGDFYVTTYVFVPEKIDSVSRHLILEFNRRNPGNPREALWGRRR